MNITFDETKVKERKKEIAARTSSETSKQQRINSSSKLYIAKNNGSILVIIYSSDQEEKLREIKRESKDSKTYEFRDVSAINLEKFFVYKGFKEGPIKFQARQDDFSHLRFDGLYQEDMSSKKDGKYSLYRFKSNHKDLIYKLGERINNSKINFIRSIDKLIS